MSIEPLNIPYITNVIFRIFPDGDIVALFPDRKKHFSNFIDCYSIMHGESVANSILIKDLEAPTKSQCKRLIDELELLGYNLRVIETW